MTGSDGRQGEAREGRSGLRILVVNWLDRENPQAGGAEEHLHHVFGRLARRGHRVTALVSGFPGCAARAELDGIAVHRTGRRYTFSLAAPRYYRRVLAAQGFDVVVDDLNKVPLFTPLWVEAPVVLLAHHLFGATAFLAGPPPVAAATWLLERPLPWVYRDVSGVVAVSESTRADLGTRGLVAERIEVVPNGIEVDRYTPGQGARAERPTLLFMGRLKRYKRVDLVVRAVARLKDEGLDADFLIAGAGDRQDALEGLARRLGVSDRVRLLGFVPEERKVELLRSAWVHVLTSEKEGWGISILEAGACGTPTVAADAPGLREAVVDGDTGLLVRSGDLEALTGALRRLLTDDRLRSDMSARARAFATRYSWDASTDAFEALLTRVVAAPGAE